MMGILFQMRKTEVRAVATDGHRLVRFTYAKFNAGKEELEVIIPAKALNLIAKSIESNDAVLTFSDTHVIFTMANITLISRKIDEKYPNYESVIPLENDKRMVVNKTQLLSSVRRTSLYASSTTHQVRLSVAKGSVSVSAEDVDFGSEACEKLTCEYSGDNIEIGFNSTYIIDILSHIDTEDVVLQFSTPTRAAIVQPSQQHDGEDLLMLVMPVRLNG
jgi:DNA polymerase-3 subunit beta